MCHMTGKQLNMSHETVHRNRIKPVVTENALFKQSEMFNYSVYSRFGNKRQCEMANTTYSDQRLQHFFFLILV